MNNKKSAEVKSDAKNSISSISQKHKKGKLNLTSKVYTGAMKFYLEQVPDIPLFINKIKAYPSTGKEGLHILAIIHNRDEAIDGDPWGSSILKPHIHLIFRCVDRKTRKRFSTLSNELGIQWRRGVDDTLLNAPHTLETCAKFENFAMYLTHETEQAINDAKELYDVSEIISNLSIDEIEQVRKGYVRVSEKRKISEDEFRSLDKEAYDLGFNLGDFLPWYQNQPFELRSSSKMTTIKKSYENGVQMRMRDTDSLRLERLCIFIQGDKDLGKTYAANKVCSKDHLTYLVDSDGTGKFDRLTPAHKAIVISDQPCPNLLNVCDDYACQVYKRNSNNPIWTGDLFVVTSNLSFNEWVVEECGIKGYETYNYGMHLTAKGEAIRSRFIICNIDYWTRQINLEKAEKSLRGSSEVQQRKWARFVEFVNSYNAILLSYDKNIEFLNKGYTPPPAPIVPIK